MKLDKNVQYWLTWELVHIRWVEITCKLFVVWKNVSNRNCIVLRDIIFCNFIVILFFNRLQFFKWSIFWSNRCSSTLFHVGILSQSCFELSQFTILRDSFCELHFVYLLLCRCILSTCYYKLIRFQIQVIINISSFSVISKRNSD